ncbi:MAG: hypothetical protein K8S54_12735 [Spirochaetia bacterium]|nr:hypothetical protein [Spirochaetia bacterium]
MSRIPVVAVICITLLSFCSDHPEQMRGFKTASVRVKKMPMRIDPLPLSGEVEILNAGDKVELLKKSAKKFRSGTVEDYWYFGRSPSGLEGWLYGGGLSVALAGTGDEVEQKFTEKQVLENLVGKWWELLPDGDTGLRKIYFWPEGKYTYGIGPADMKEGKYKIRLADKVIELKDGSPAGDKLEFRFIGQEMRLSGDAEGKNYLFKRGELNPEAREVADEKKDKDKAEQQKIKPGDKKGTEDGSKKPSP